MNADRYLRLQIALTDGLMVECDEHRKLLDLCKTGDVDAACVFLRRHILIAAEDLASFLTKHRQGG